MLYTHPGERVERGSCEPARPVQAICCEDDMPGQRPRFTAEYAGFAGPPGSPEGASKTGPPPSATGYAASWVTSRQRHRARTRIRRQQRGRRPGSRPDGATSMTLYPGPRLPARRSCLPAARPGPLMGG